MIKPCKECQFEKGHSLECSKYKQPPVPKVVGKVVDMYSKEQTIKSYVVSGIPASSIPALMKELGLSVKKFKTFMAGQTVGVVGNEAVYYICDIERFVKGLPVID